MGLSLNLDANLHFVVEPGYRSFFTAAGLATANGGAALDPYTARTLWNPPGTGIITLKPLQMQPDFLNHQAQLDQGAVLRLSDFFVNPQDLAENRINEINIGTTADPWINHVPASNIIGPPTKTVVGVPQVFYTLQQVADQSETGSTGVFDTTPQLPQPVPNALIWLGFTPKIFPQNQGWLFRWWVAPPHLTRHQQIYAFVFAQYCALCRDALLEVYEDTSFAGTRDQWTRRYRGSLFVSGMSENDLNPIWPLGKQLPEDSTGHFASLMVVPVGRQKVLFLAHTGHTFIATVRAHPRRTLDGKEWDRLRADSVSVWALTPSVGQFQVQKLLYPVPLSFGSAATLYLPDIIMEYTPAITPDVRLQGDADADSQLTPTLPIFPKNYTFPAGPLADDCPKATNLASGQQRTFGERIRFVGSTDQRVSPQLYGIEIVSEPVFQNNPATQFNVFDTQGAPRVLHVETSVGSNPGDGRLTARLYDVPRQAAPFDFPLAPYQFRSEMPVQLALDGRFTFSGYTERTEVQLLRHDPVGAGAAPIEMRFRCNDRWLLLENTILREQTDWQHVGHITVVDTIARQCGIDTGPLHPDGTNLPVGLGGGPSMAGGSLAEYPAGWDGALSSSYNTPLGTPIQNSDNLEGNQLAGWKPQPNDTGAAFIKRITDLFSNWLVGFRADGTFSYLPYTYFTTPALIFHANADRYVTSGLLLSPSTAALTVNVSPGMANLGGPLTAPANVLGGLAPNASNTIYLMADGTVSANTNPSQPPPDSVTLGTAATNATMVTATDISATSPRQTKLSRIYRRPVEFRTIEPSGNIVQLQSHYQLDQTSNRSGLFIDYASIRNPKVVNYLGRPKWFYLLTGGAFSCAQLNRMAYIAFQAARRRRKRVSFDADYVPSLKVGQVFTLEGLGDFRMLEMRATYTRQGWAIANYVGEAVEKGYGLSS